MSNIARLGVFFACDTGSNAFMELRSGLESLTAHLGLHLVVYDQQVPSDDGVLDKVEKSISRSICLIADIGADPARPLNGNVMLEIGFARGLARPILFITHDPDKLPANLRGRDVVKFPECLRIGSVECNKTIEFLKNLGRGLLEGREVRIFSSQSGEYLELLKKINALPGREWFVSPELRSFLRPVWTEDRWLRDVRRVAVNGLERDQTLRSDRRRAFEQNLKLYGCVDIYLLEALQLKTWRDMDLTTQDKAGFLAKAIQLLEEYPLYQIVFVEHNDRQKYRIKESELGKFVIFEQWGYVDVRRNTHTGGLVMADPSVVQSFKEETERTMQKGLHTRQRVVEVLREELDKCKGSCP